MFWRMLLSHTCRVIFCTLFHCIISLWKDDTCDAGIPESWNYQDINISSCWHFQSWCKLSGYVIGSHCLVMYWRYLGIPRSSTDASQSFVFNTDWRQCQGCVSTEVALPSVTDQQTGILHFVHCQSFNHIIIMLLWTGTCIYDIILLSSQVCVNHNYLHGKMVAINWCHRVQIAYTFFICNADVMEFLVECV